MIWSSSPREAYVYGFPLVFDLEEVERFSKSGMGSVPAAPFNTFAHATQLAGPQDTFVSINNDTVYSIAQLDVSGGPVRLRVPDAEGRYYVLQFVDAWTNNFAYVGHRATGTKAATFLLVPAGWDGAPGDGDTVIHLPTHVATIVGRWAVAGGADMPAVRELQAGLTWRKQASPERAFPNRPRVSRTSCGSLSSCASGYRHSPGRPRSRVSAAVLTARAP